jgi:ribosomal protein S18 acetylase RimI-like enzyme
VNGGWVDKLGVLEKFRGQGFGQLLLQWGIAHAANKGYTSVGLGADTGNDSGALELYFKMGFEVQLSWRMYSRKK